MRLRNIPRAESTIEAHDAVINQPEAERGKWAKVFGRVPRKLDFGFRKRPSDTDRDRNGKRTLLIKYGKNLS